MMNFEHIPVLLDEVIASLKIKSDGIHVDGTLGGGGHAFEVGKQLGPKGRLIGIDQDENALEASKVRLEAYGDKVTLIRSNYEQMKKVLEEIGIYKVDSILLDLGVSSHQLDVSERGFSYREEDAPLDMRMDQRQILTAREMVNTYNEEKLYQIIRTYGEERFARSIAHNIIKARMDKPIETAGELNQIIEYSIPAKNRWAGGHPAKRTYQALRIALNRELEVLEESLDGMIELLNPGGRICIITFHSLEDRIVKESFRRNQDPCSCPKDFPVCICGAVSRGKVITRKPMIPRVEEIEGNPRSKSAKLRVFESYADSQESGGAQHKSMGIH